MNFAKMKRKMFNKFVSENEKYVNDNYREKLNNWAAPIDETTGKRFEITKEE